MLKILLMIRFTNEEVLNRMPSERELLLTDHERKLKYCGQAATLFATRVVLGFAVRVLRKN